VTACTHHWVIDTPKGALSTGKCKHCLQTKQFKNGGDYWKDDWNVSNGSLFDEYAASGRRDAARRDY